MKNTILNLVTYLLALLFTGSFFYTLSVIFTFNMLVGGFVVAFLLFCALNLFTDIQPLEA